MIAGADSSGYHPTLAQLQAAYAQGVRVWGFYLPGPGIYSGHSKADFDRAHQARMKSIGWASGWADPAQQRALAASWNVDYPTLDDEDGIRPGGPWVQPWLDTSAFGLYAPFGSNGARLTSRRAPWLIMADYLGTYPNFRDPQATWYGTAPSVPHGWQWAGSVNAYGGNVDRLWLDDRFLGDAMTPEQEAKLDKANQALDTLYSILNALAQMNAAAGLPVVKTLNSLTPGSGSPADPSVTAKLDRLLAQLRTP